MNLLKNLCLSAGILAFGFSIPAISAPIPACAGTFSEFTNTFGTPSGDFLNCWVGTGTGTVGVPGPTLSSTPGVNEATLQSAIGISFLFAAALPGYNIVSGSVIVNEDVTIHDGDVLSVDFTNGGSPGVGFLVLEQGFTGYTFFKLFDNSSFQAAWADGFTTGPLTAGQYEVALGVVFTPPVSNVTAINAETDPSLTVNGVSIVSSVPEPTTALLLLIGMTGVALAMWRRRQATR